MFNTTLNHVRSNTALCGIRGLSIPKDNDMQKTTSFPGSAALNDFVLSICSTDAHINVVPRGVWVDCAGGFLGQAMSSVTTYCDVVRAFTCLGVTYWTLERWEHDNGYRCTLEVLTKDEFLHLIA